LGHDLQAAEEEAAESVLLEAMAAAEAAAAACRVVGAAVQEEIKHHKKCFIYNAKLHLPPCSSHMFSQIVYILTEGGGGGILWKVACKVVGMLQM